MRVDWIIPCKFVEVVNGLATIVGAGADTHHVPQFPLQVVATLAVRLTGPHLANPTNHKLTAQVLGPDMQPVSAPLEVEMTAQSQASAPGDAEGQILMAMQHRFVAAEPGMYTATVALDGRSESVCIRVVEQQPKQ